MYVIWYSYDLWGTPLWFKNDTTWEKKTEIFFIFDTKACTHFAFDYQWNNLISPNKGVLNHIVERQDTLNQFLQSTTTQTWKSDFCSLVAHYLEFAFIFETISLVWTNWLITQNSISWIQYNQYIIANDAMQMNKANGQYHLPHHSLGWFICLVVFFNRVLCQFGAFFFYVHLPVSCLFSFYFYVI